MYSFKWIISQVFNLSMYSFSKGIYLRLKLILCHLSLYCSYFTKENLCSPTLSLTIITQGVKVFGEPNKGIPWGCLTPEEVTAKQEDCKKYWWGSALFHPGDRLILGSMSIYISIYLRIRIQKWGGCHRDTRILVYLNWKMNPGFFFFFSPQKVSLICLLGLTIWTAFAR